jgi:autotransporter-associated beta strand protein
MRMTETIMKTTMSAAMTAVCAVLLAAAVQAADRIWDGGGDANWSTAANWDGDATAPVADDALFFGGTLGLVNSNDLDEGTSLSGITFNSGAGLFVLDGNGILLGGDVLNSDADTQTINLPMMLDATRTVNAVSGAVALGGVLSGSGGLTKSGAKTLTLAGANTYEGETLVQAGGRLLITHGEALGSALAGTTIQTGTGIEIYNGITVAEPLTLVNQNSGSMTFQTGSNVYSGLITITGGQARVQNQSMYAHITGGITSFNSTVILDTGSAAGTPVMRISGKPILAGTQKTFVHGTRTAIFAVAGNVFNTLEVSGGKLLLEVPNAWPDILRLEVGVSYARNSHIDLQGNDQTIGTLTGVITNDGIRTLTSSTGPATLTVNQSDTTDFNSNFAGELRLVKLGAGQLTVSGTNCLQSGQTVIGGGKLRILSEATLGVEPASFVADQLVVSNGATLLATGPCVLDDVNRGIMLGSGNGMVETASGADMTVSNAITGIGGLTKAGAGTLTLAGVNDYAGVTAVNAGILQVGQKASLYNGAALVADDFTVSSGAALLLNVGGTGEFTSGDVSAIAALGTSTTGFKPGSWLALTATNAPDAAYEVSDLIGNPSDGHGLNLQKLGDGTLVLSGLNTYTGVTKITRGVLSVSNLANGGSPSAIGASSNSSANLLFDGGLLRYTGPTVGIDRDFKANNNTSILFEVTQPDTTLTFEHTYGSSFVSTDVVVKSGPGTLTFGYDKTDARPFSAFYTDALVVRQGRLLTVAGDTIQVNLKRLAGAGPALTLGDGAELGFNTPIENYINDAEMIVRYDGTQSCARITSGQLTLTGPTTNSVGDRLYNTHIFDVNDGADEIDLDISSQLNIYSSIANSHVRKTGAGTLRLKSSSSTFRGTTLIRAGRLLVSANVPKGGNSVLGNCTNDVVIGDAGTQFSDTPALLFDGPANSAFTFARGIATWATNGVSTFGSLSNVNVTLSGPVTVSNTLQLLSVTTGTNALFITGGISGPGGVTMGGTGTVLFVAANSYTGVTDVAEGTLRLGASERLADTSGLRLSGGTFDPAGFDETMGALDVDAAAELDFGAGACTLTFADSASQTWDGTLLLRNWKSGVSHLFVGASASLTETQLAKITSPSGQIAAQLSSGEVILLPLGTVLLLQ